MNLFLCMLSLNLKTALSMRAAFLIRLVYTLANHSFILAMWLFFFNAVPMVSGWTLWHLLAAYGLSWFAWGFISFFAYGFRMLARTIEFGELDHFLLQPRPLLLMLAANSGEVFGLPDMALAATLLICAAIKLHLAWGLVLLAMACATATIGAFTLAIGSLAFWLNDMHDWLLELQYLLFIFSTRPSSAFKGWVKFLMFTFLPMGFITFLPVEILRLESPKLIGLELLGTSTLVALSLLLFRQGLKHYASGNRFGVRT